MGRDWKKAADLIKKGRVVVIPTDTLFAVAASALDPEAVEKVYQLRGRNEKKPCIVLCGRMADLSVLKIETDEKTFLLLKKIWPNSVSVVLNCPSKNLEYLHRGNKSLAIRLPKNKKLLEFLKITGPIIAPSANKEGGSPARNVAEAKRYFGNGVLEYVAGKVGNKPSTLVRLKNGKIETIRRGVWKVPKNLT